MQRLRGGTRVAGTEQEDTVLSGEAEGLDCVGFVGLGKEFGFLSSVGFGVGEGYVQLWANTRPGAMKETKVWAKHFFL